MCDPETLSQILGTEVGGLAPFGYELNVQLVVSSTLFKQKYIYLNPGRNDATICISGEDFKSVMLGNKARIL
ncbi:hypothetical protein ACX27_00495 [Nostoc piscinale CENA21]|uniref:YbaK/aminoacyl-tRNA synthetase-associated domain-containing protein n=1 Tax=Nostoc piscinale CENA21 TaxID=224013 RepID=A0A0M4SN22_9NOSO|nr:hypothetical protein ACX27_00495 [Nostoc piscinale CENA21]